MLLNLIGSGDPLVGLITFIIVIGILVVVISVHEFAHAYAAFKLGDPTAKALGRLTLNPLSHLDPIGTLLLVVLGFGWGKPVPFNPNYFANPRRDSAIVSFAGPLSNFLFAAVFAGVKALLPGLGILSLILEALIYLNLVLCFFNLIPIHPLDGFKVVWGLLPHDLASQWMDLAPYGIFVLMLLIFTGFTQTLIGVPVEFFLRLML